MKLNLGLLKFHYFEYHKSIHNMTMKKEFESIKKSVFVDSENSLKQIFRKLKKHDSIETLKDKLLRFHKIEDKQNYNHKYISLY